MRGEKRAGRVGIWDTRHYARVGEWDTGGIGPHDLRVRPDGTLVVAVTPTYSGCPATGVINLDIERALREHVIDWVIADAGLVAAE